MLAGPILVHRNTQDTGQRASPSGNGATCGTRLLRGTGGAGSKATHAAQNLRAHGPELSTCPGCMEAGKQAWGPSPPWRLPRVLHRSSEVDGMSWEPSTTLSPAPSTAWLCNPPTSALHFAEAEPIVAAFSSMSPNTLPAQSSRASSALTVGMGPTEHMELRSPPLRKGDAA